MTALVPLNIARRQSLLTGLGFALGFGWLWFPALQGFWLPEFLWGDVFSGGGASLFCALLLAGFCGIFAAVGFGGARLSGPARRSEGGDECAAAADNSEVYDFRASRLPHFVHGVAVALVAAALLPPASITGVRPYLPVSAMAAAALLQGVFWGGAMLALGPRWAAGAMVVAAFTAAVFSGAASLLFSLGVRWRGVLLLAAVLAAWVVARSLVRLLRLPRPELKRPRGRPAKSASVEDVCDAGLRQAGFKRLTLGAAGAALVLLALAESLTGRMTYAHVFFASPQATGTLVFLGAALGFLLCAGDAYPDGRVEPRDLLYKSSGPFLFRAPFFSLSPAVSVCAALGLSGLALAGPAPLVSALGPIALSGAEGFIGVAAASVLAWDAAGHSLHPLRRAALVLGVALVLSNTGAAAGKALVSIFAHTDQAAPIRAAAGLLVCAAGVFFAAYCRRKRKVEGARICRRLLPRQLRRARKARAAFSRRGRKKFSTC